MKYSVVNVKKTLLIITPYIPYPLNSGGNISQFEMDDALRKDYQLNMVFPLNTKEDMINYEVLKSKWADITFFPYYPLGFSKIIKQRKKMQSALYRLYNKVFCLGKKLSETDKFVIKHTTLFRSRRIEFDQAFVSHVKKTIDVTKPDAIQVEFFDLLPIVKFLPKSIPSIFVHHELRYIREKRELAIIDTDIPLLKGLQNKNEAFEFSWLSKYDKILTVSFDDAALLNKHFEAEKVSASPLSIKYKTKLTSPFQFDNKLIFLGGDEHFPNKEGLNWFVNTCWKELKASNTALKLHVIGKWTSESVDQYASDESIIFEGFVEDLAKALANAIFIVPIRIGSGMRMKIIEAVNHGLPFVTTTVGVEGLNFKKNVDCLVGDTPASFKEQIVKIIAQPNLANDLVKNARETLKSGFSYEQSINLRKEIYESI